MFLRSLQWARRLQHSKLTMRNGSKPMHRKSPPTTHGQKLVRHLVRVCGNGANPNDENLHLYSLGIAVFLQRELRGKLDNLQRQALRIDSAVEFLLRGC